jgi:hypothetical protein
MYDGDANYVPVTSPPLIQAISLNASPTPVGTPPPPPTPSPLPLPLPPQTVVFTGPYLLTLAVQGCGSVTPASEAGAHMFGDSVLLTAVPCASSRFVGWQGGLCDGTAINPCAIAMPPTNLAVTAVFAP